MNKKQRFSPPMVGGSSLLVIFAVLCLTVFAMLSLGTVLASERLSAASVKAVADYYEADYRAEEIFARLRAGQMPEGVVCREEIPEAGEKSGVMAWKNGETPVGAAAQIYTYACPISEIQTLWVELKWDGETWTVLRWQAAAEGEVPEDVLIVWDGETIS